MGAWGHYVPKCISCHKATVVIIGRAHSFHDNIYIMLILLSCLCEIWTLCLWDTLWQLTPVLGHMMCSYTLLLLINQRVISKLCKEHNRSAYKWSTLHRVLKSYRRKTDVIHICNHEHNVLYRSLQQSLWPRWRIFSWLHICITLIFL